MKLIDIRTSMYIKARSLSGLFAFGRLMNLQRFNSSIKLGAIAYPYAHFLRLRNSVNYRRPTFRPSNQ